MALAMLYPDPEKAYRGKRTEAGKVLESKGFSPAMLSQARTIFRHSRALAEDVMADRMKFAPDRRYA